MARVKRSIMEANAFRLLAFLDGGAKGRKRTAVVSLRTMATELQLSHARVRRLVRILADRGYLEVQRCYAEDGGDRPNAHCITRAGRAALKAHRAASGGVEGAEGSKGDVEMAGALAGAARGQHATD